MRIERRGTGLAVALIAATLCAVGSDGLARRHRAEPRPENSVADNPGLVIGEFRLARKAVLDGDTIRVVGLPKTLRLIGIDTEETFKHEEDRREAQQDFQAYLRRKRGDSPHPVKAGTPLGEEGRRFAEAFFRDVDTVRLERDHPKEIRGYYGRFLAYVFAQKDGRWVNYNLEVVRAGLSPYFTKYGYSRRFHEEFVKAQQEAQAARRGIWDPRLQHYDDYEERIAWWNARADFLREAEREEAQRDDLVILTRWDAWVRLRALIGREAVVVGSVGRVVTKDRVTLVLLARRKTEDFPLVFFDRQVFERSRIAEHVGEYVRVQGRVRLYQDPRRPDQEVIEMVVARPEDVRAAKTPQKAADSEPGGAAEAVAAAEFPSRWSRHPVRAAAGPRF